MRELTLNLPDDLNPMTAALVAAFAEALAEKLTAAQAKYGYSDRWASPDWMHECRAKLMEHIAKGDPRDVAAYCAFLWHHGALTAQPQAAQPAPHDDALAITFDQTQRAREIVLDVMGLDLISGDRPAKKEDRSWVYRRLGEAMGLLTGTHVAATPPTEPAPGYTYASKQSTKCASCGKEKHTPLRIDAMGGYVCLTCIDQKLGALLGEFGYPEPAPQAEPAPQSVDLENLPRITIDADGSTFADGYEFQHHKDPLARLSDVRAALAKRTEKTLALIQVITSPAPQAEPAAAGELPPLPEREQFEAWCCKRWAGDRNELTIREDGEYLNGHVQFAWSAWQAALASAPHAREPLSEAEIEVLRKEAMVRGKLTFNAAHRFAEAIQKKLGIG